MNSDVASSSVIRRMVCSEPLGRRMKRSIFCGMRISAFIALPSLARASCSAMEKPRLGMNGNGCAGSMASGVSTGKTWVRKRSSSQSRSAFFRSPASTSTTPAAASVGAQRQPWRCWSLASCCHRLADAGKLLVRRQPVRALLGDALAHLTLQAGDAHHEEFVEVVGRDREKAHPFEHRVALGWRPLPAPGG